MLKKEVALSWKQLKTAQGKNEHVAIRRLDILEAFSNSEIIFMDG